MVETGRNYRQKSNLKLDPVPPPFHVLSDCLKFLATSPMLAEKLHSALLCIDFWLDIVMGVWFLGGENGAEATSLFFFGNRSHTKSNGRRPDLLDDDVGALQRSQNRRRWQKSSTIIGTPYLRFGDDESRGAGRFFATQLHWNARQPFSLDPGSV